MAQLSYYNFEIFLPGKPLGTWVTCCVQVFSIGNDGNTELDGYSYPHGEMGVVPLHPTHVPIIILNYKSLYKKNCLAFFRICSAE